VRSMSENIRGACVMLYTNRRIPYVTLLIPLLTCSANVDMRQCETLLTARLHLVGDGISSGRQTNGSKTTDFFSHF